MNKLEYLGNALIAENGVTTTPTSNLDQIPILGLLFSAKWCPTCKIFNKKLTKIYESVNRESRLFEIVQISSDLALEEYQSELKTVPWLGVKFDVARSDSITEQFDVTSIPTLIVLGAERSIINVDGRGLILKFGEEVVLKWIKDNV